VKPGAERPPAVEAIEGPDRGEERLLGDVLRSGAVADHHVCGPVRAAPMAPEELLDRLLGSPLRVADEARLTPAAEPGEGSPQERW
jgi:hypothetical protein